MLSFQVKQSTKISFDTMYHNHTAFKDLYKKSLIQA